MSTIRSLSLCLPLIFGFAACSSEDVSTRDQEENNAWKVGEFDAGRKGGTDEGNNLTAPPGPADFGRSEDMLMTATLLPFDSGTPTSSVDAGGEDEGGGTLVDMSSSEDMPAEDIDMSVGQDMTQAPDAGGVTGDACMVNSDCVSAGDLCCPSFGGQAECTPNRRCRLTPGGYCDAATVRTDCGQGKFCCPPRSGNGQNVCSDSACRPQPVACTTNSQCTVAGQVCCPRGQGSGECVAEAMCRLGGGFCQSNAECSMTQPNCCSLFNLPKVCSARMCP